MKRDRILSIGSFSVKEENAGSQRALGLSRIFIRQGFKVATVGCDQNVKSGCPVLSTFFRRCDVDCYTVSAPKNALQWLYRMTAIRPFLTVARHYGVNRIFAVVAMDYEIIALVRLGHWCKKHDIVLICDNVEWYEKSVLPFPARLIKNLDTNLRMNWYYPHAQAMITISRFLFDKYKGYGFPVVEVPSNVDKSDPKWAHLSFWHSRKERVIAYAGNPGKHCSKERVDLLITAVCMLYSENLPCRLRLAGFDQSTFEADYPDLKNLPGYGRIEYIGKIKHRQCIALLNDSDFSAVIRDDRQSTRAGFPTKLAESIASGTPVIATPSSNITDYLHEGKTCMMTKDFSLQAIKSALRKALEIPDATLQRMHAECRTDGSFDVAQFETRVFDFLQSIKREVRKS